jgi:hypothetical protein
MREQKETAHRLAAYSDAVFAVIVTVMVLEPRAPEQATFSALGPLWPTAISYAVSYLFIAIIWINHQLPYAVRRDSHAGIDMDKLRPSLHGVALAVCDSLGCTHAVGITPGSFLRRAVRVHRHSPSMSSSAMCSPTRTSLKSPGVRATERGFDHSLSLRFSPQLC